MGFKAPPELKAEEKSQYQLALLGFHRDASSLLYNLEQSDLALVNETLVIDFNVALHRDISKRGAQVKYGDLANPETLHHLGLSHAKVIVCTIPDDLLRGIDNRSLVHVVREISPNAVIIANAINFDEVQAVYDAGADFVYMSRLESAHCLEQAIGSALQDRIEVFRNERRAQNHNPLDRKEVLR